MSIGPKTTVKRSCADCEVCQGERYTCQSDSGRDVYCAHPSLPQRRIIGDTRWDTPQWCPAEPEIAARADARIAELERECSQWRDELRIYRETENKRIAELETDLELARRDVERYRWLRDESGNDHHTPWCAVGYSDPTWLTGEHLDAAIDAARAGNGGEW